MKALNLALLGLLLAGTAGAQDSPAPSSTNAPAVTITQVRSRKEVFVPALYEDPMQVNQDQQELLRDQKATIRANVERARQGQVPLPIPGKKIASNTPVGSTPMGVPLGDEPAGNRNLPAKAETGPSSVHFIYEARIKNDGEKTIRAIFWTHVILDKESQAILGRHSFRSVVSLRSGKTANLVGRSKTAPVAVVNAAKSAKAGEAIYAESISIDRVEYSDGTFWQAPDPMVAPGLN